MLSSKPLQLVILRFFFSEYGREIYIRAIYTGENKTRLS